MSLIDSLVSIAYPQACRVCEKSVEEFNNGVVCSACWEKSYIFEGEETLCNKCGQFLSDRRRETNTFCHKCDADFYDKASAVGKYELALTASILNLKQEPTISKHLKTLFIDAFLRSSFQDATRIIPVPLSKARYLERGFNQARVLAKVLAKEIGVVLDDKSLIRTKHTKTHRAGMDKKGREMSVAKSFEVKRKNLIKDENILLIDDVFTSGATASACAKVLKKNGASKVYVFTIARTV